MQREKSRVPRLVRPQQEAQGWSAAQHSWNAQELVWGEMPAQWVRREFGRFSQAPRCCPRYFRWVQTKGGANERDSSPPYPNSVCWPLHTPHSLAVPTAPLPALRSMAARRFGPRPVQCPFRRSTGTYCRNYSTLAHGFPGENRVMITCINVVPA